jgi:hypothetical protein
LRGNGSGNVDVGGYGLPEQGDAQKKSQGHTYFESQWTGATIAFHVLIGPWRVRVWC